MRQVLRFIARYSVKYSGASHLKTATIAEGIGKTDRTVRRVMSTLEGFGIIERINTTRKKSGGSGANIVRILPFTTDVMTARLSEREVTEKARTASDKPDNSPEETLHKREDQEHILETAALRGSIPAELYDKLSPFFNVKELYEVIGTLYRAKASINKSIRAEDHPEYIDAFLACVRRFKTGKVRSLSGYLYASWRKVSRGIYWRQMAEDMYV
ncbi:hypothetical protein [Halobacillus seohaensis]|uniref:Helix-turn-helix domain-containing protein n=1 Tax=Halobacillus seohaensis TaxID=447421 RepID=A0ABW2ENM6_9BACI